MKAPPPSRRIPVRLTPWRRFFLVMWTCLIMFLCLWFFRRLGVRLAAVMMIVGGVIGLLVGRRLLMKFDDVLDGFFGGSERSAREDVLQFLKQKRASGQFSMQELAKWCRQRGLDPVQLATAAAKQLWCKKMGGSYVITSVGEKLMRSYFGKLEADAAAAEMKEAKEVKPPE